MTPTPDTTCKSTEIEAKGSVDEGDTMADEGDTMADEGIVALREALGKIMESEHADLRRESVALVVCEAMELEASERAGAERYERSAGRSTYRNGYRQREWDTRVGTIELAIPKLRQGAYLPSFLNAWKRAEQALLGVVLNGSRILCSKSVPLIPGCVRFGTLLCDRQNATEEPVA